MALCNFVIGAIGSANALQSGSIVLIVSCAVWALAYALSVAPIGKSCAWGEVIWHTSADTARLSGWLAIVELSTPMLRAKTAGIAAVLQSLSGVVFVSQN